MAGGPPPYPLPPQPGSNAIGSFIVGQSPIGTISGFSVFSTIISQFVGPNPLTNIITSFAAAVDVTALFDSVYDNIWNIFTAQGYGLDVWGRILQVSRVLQIPSLVTGPYIGFEEATGSWFGFGQAPFYTGGTLTTNFTLTDNAYRTLLLAKAAANICSGSIPAINAILLALFPGRGPCYVVDGENMTMQYVFNFTLSPVELAIVEESGVLPKPVGVAATVVQI